MEKPDYDGTFHYYNSTKEVCLFNCRSYLIQKDEIPKMIVCFSDHSENKGTELLYAQPELASAFWRSRGLNHFSSPMISGRNPNREGSHMRIVFVEHYPSVKLFSHVVFWDFNEVCGFMNISRRPLEGRDLAEIRRYLLT